MSYWGLAGGLWVTMSLVLTAALTLASDHSHSRRDAVIYGVLALAFVPAIVISLITSERRNVVLRAETALCLLLGAVAFVLFDPGLPTLLVPGLVLLATGAGIVFGRGSQKEG